MDNSNIVLISGLKGSGKNVVGEWFSNCGYTQLSFADKLKDVVSVMFGFDRNMLDGVTEEDRYFRELKEQWWTEQLGFELSPRKALQLIGTDLFRNNFHKDIWVLSIINQMYVNTNYVFTDVRFLNEIELIKQHFPNVITINIERNPLPDWYINKDKIKAKLSGVHESEYALLGYNFDYIFQNNGTIAELHSLLTKEFNYE